MRDSLIKSFEEIKKVGFVDWWWFVVVLKRDEFHSSLRISNPKYTMHELIRQRSRAHRVDEILNEN